MCIRDSLEVFQVNRDKATNENKVSAKPVISIPVKHIDYRCKQNDFNECTGSEEENKQILESQRRFFLPDLEKTDIIEKSFLPIALDGIDDKCFTKKKQTVVGGKLEKDALSIELEATYETKPECVNVSNVEGIEDLLERMTFRVRYYVSIVKSKSLADPEYKEILYSGRDQSTFGFFTTEESVLDVDNRNTETSRIVKLNRWSPNKKKLIYYLNHEFEKPEYAQLKTLSFKAGEAVAQALKTAGANIDFEIQMGQKEMVPENLRNTMIVLVPEPLDSGLLGYGPSSANPATGEILHAGVIMYAGNMKQYINRTWDEVVRAYIESQMPQVPLAEKEPEKKEQPSNSRAAVSRQNLENQKTKIPGINIEKTISDTIKYSNHSYMPKERILGISQKKESELKSINEALTYGSLMDYYSRNNYYHSDVFNFGGAILGAFKGKIPGDLLKPWSQLTASERQSVIDLTLPHVWSVTLIHEIGHTLGLRHNFAGSEDDKNFYDKKELEKNGIDYAIPFSSVMEYPFSDIGALPIMGKYDVAALAFGYSRKLFTKSGKLVDVTGGGVMATKTRLKAEFEKLPQEKQTQKEKDNFELSDFEFCTDEHVEVNPGCKRFDTGTNLPEIAQHLINTYESFYEYRNKRNGRRNFSATNDGAYAIGMAQNFRYMRMFFERYEDFAEQLPMVDNWSDPTYIANANSRKYLTELKESVILIGKHFMDVLTEPDQTCVLHDSETNETVALPLVTWMDRRAAGLKKVDPDLFSCSELSFSKDSGEMLAEIGKPFSNRKSPDNANNYADQIDTRGIWSDKLLAAYFLLTRKIGLGTVDNFSANFLDVPELQGRLIVLLKTIILDEVAREFKISTPKGVVSVEAHTPMDISHLIRPSMSGLANRMFGISGEFRFSKAILNTIKLRVPSVVDRPLADSILENFVIYTRLTEDEIRHGGFQTIVTSDGKRYYFRAEKNSLAKDINTRITIRDNLQGLSKDSVTKIVAALTELDKIEKTEERPAKIEELKKSLIESEAKSFDYFAKLPNGQIAIQRFLGGAFKERAYYEDVLESMIERTDVNVNVSVRVKVDD